LWRPPARPPQSRSMTRSTSLVPMPRSMVLACICNDNGQCVTENCLQQMNGDGKHEVQQAVQEAATIYPRPLQFTFDLLTLKVVPESRVTWATSARVQGSRTCTSAVPSTNIRRQQIPSTATKQRSKLRELSRCRKQIPCIVTTIT